MKNKLRNMNTSGILDLSFILSVNVKFELLLSLNNQLYLWDYFELISSFSLSGMSKRELAKFYEFLRI